MKHPETSARLKYMVVQIHPNADPVMKEIQSNFLTGDGTLVAFTCDGYYLKRADAEGVAAHLNEVHPHLTTHVVEILSTWRASA